MTAKTKIPPASASRDASPLSDRYRMPSDPYALEVLVRGRQELDRVGERAWRHRRADGQLVTIVVPGRSEQP